MKPKEVMELARQIGAGELPGEVISAIWQINNGAENLNKGDHEAVVLHNERVLAAHQRFDNWVISLPDYESRSKAREFRAAVLETGRPSIPTPNLTRVLPGKIGHTNPLNPMVEGTGLSGQEKPPRYDKDGHTV